MKILHLMLVLMAVSQGLMFNSFFFFFPNVTTWGTVPWCPSHVISGDVSSGKLDFFFLNSTFRILEQSETKIGYASEHP